MHPRWRQSRLIATAEGITAGGVQKDNEDVKAHAPSSTSAVPALPYPERLTNVEGENQRAAGKRRGVRLSGNISRRPANLSAVR